MTKAVKCSHPGCDRKAKARGLCNPHYMDAWRAGQIQPRIMKPPTGVTYISMHHWLLYNLGSASLQQCVDCGKQAKHWSYLEGCPDEQRDEKRGTYCPHPEHYSPRCVKCHHAHDKPALKRKPKTHCKRGHEFTLENTYRKPNGNRGCKICRREAGRRFRDKSV